MTFAEKEQYDKFNIKYLSSKIAGDRYNNDIEIKNKIMDNIKKEQEENEKCNIINNFLEQYKNKAITETILNNDIKIHEYYDYCDLLNDSSFNYECPICNKINTFEETYSCENCEKLVCDNCVESKNINCGIKNCSYCRKSHCYNLETFMYCTNCFIDDNLDFYNTYKDTIITADILNENKSNLDFYELEEYELKYNCPICLTTTDLNSTNMCNKCDDYICNDCSNTVINNDECLNNNCRFCREGLCRYSYNECVCNSCYNEYDYNSDNISYDNSEDENSNDENNKINLKIRCTSPCNEASNKDNECNICYIYEKKYACVPCGHRCMCGNCANKINDRCPICKEQIKDIIKIYL